MTIGDDKSAFITTTSNFQPAAGETWKVTGIAAYSAQANTNEFVMEITDGVDTVSFIRCYDIYAPSAASGALSHKYVTWGDCGNVNKGIRTALTEVSTHLSATTSSNNGTLGGALYISNTNYLSITITGTANCFIQAELVKDASTPNYLEDVSEFVTSTSTMQPGAGEEYLVTGVCGHANSYLNTNGFFCAITDGATTYPLFYAHPTTITSSNLSFTYGEIVLGGCGTRVNNLTGSDSNALIYKKNCAAPWSYAGGYYGRSRWQYRLTNTNYLSFTETGAYTVFINALRTK